VTVHGTAQAARTTLRPPIIVDAKTEIFLFRTIEGAAAYLEAIDVRNGEYSAAYDSEGRRIALHPKSVIRRTLLGLFRTRVELVDLQPLESEPSHAVELTQLLRRHLADEGRLRPSGESLRELVEAAVARLGYTSSSS
jgi:hypothetical protein